jgi:hypothetical protein
VYNSQAPLHHVLLVVVVVVVVVVVWPAAPSSKPCRGSRRHPGETCGLKK